jgi:hypothetical protein
MTLDSIPRLTTVLSIGGHQFEPDDFTSLVGVKPSKVWTQKHEWIKLTHPDFDIVGWFYELKEQRKWSLGEAIGEVLDVVWSKKEQVGRFLSDNGLTMHIRCRPFGDASVLEYIIQPEAMKKLAFFGASLSLAVYKDEL